MRSTIMAAMVLAVTGTATAAEKPIDTYYARLSERDHYSSSGQRLSKVAGIIRQDRANVHQFGKVDAEDEKTNSSAARTIVPSSRICLPMSAFHQSIRRQSSTRHH
ncbi:hypothetical protein HED51_19680 [Ochrobactrum grignonense]|nr:hypothetical protein [Brucella grignonensis]